MPKKIDEKDGEKIVEVLEGRGATLPCPRCGNRSFTLIDGYFLQSVQKDLSGAFVIGGNNVPSVATACTQCGYLSHHALGILGLLPKQGD